MKTTLVWRECPRCARLGAVSPAEEPGYVNVVWRGTEDRSEDRTEWVTAAELFNPSFGCGYDDPKTTEPAPRRRMDIHEATR